MARAWLGQWDTSLFKEAGGAKDSHSAKQWPEDPVLRVQGASGGLFLSYASSGAGPSCLTLLAS